ncbi:bis(5'-nucleosyl)-tetraphosphatase (symmetrical) [Actimicrobium sp. GrIS 1.19]|uniref:symmetrical bis(5'-nucleosyl)-tetraphosphatase n=1 Tax=Actimicrobium sp. GrIS 1.19 TaxID=3071708 RepID=UPI002E0C3856|nr:bis(5'-nucleosyl)-tetraphosphatase (symmetrical) [Actimicrobium sp. GrIS 1.19]
MSLYIVGDLQGCASQLQALMHKIDALDPDARWFFVGDLVNRGPRSLDTLRLIRQLGNRADCVLGNHDLHLLAVANGVRKAGRSDTIDEILKAPDGDDLLDWLRHRPLARLIDGHLIVHAGVLPQWSAAQTLALAGEVETVLRSPGALDFLRNMYGNTPGLWDDTLEGNGRLRCIVNALTRMRYCTPDGRMEFNMKESAGIDVEGYLPWFDLPQRQSADVTVVFGHWSALGLIRRENLIGLDSGCVWGGKLSAVRLSDHALFQVDCPQYQQPG